MRCTILEVWFLCLSADVQYLLGLQLLAPRSVLPPDHHVLQPLQSRTLVAKSCASLAQHSPALSYWRRDVVPSDQLQMGTESSWQNVQNCPQYFSTGSLYIRLFPFFFLVFLFFFLLSYTQISEDVGFVCF